MQIPVLERNYWGTSDLNYYVRDDAFRVSMVESNRSYFFKFKISCVNWMQTEWKKRNAVQSGNISMAFFPLRNAIMFHFPFSELRFPLVVESISQVVGRSASFSEPFTCSMHNVSDCAKFDAALSMSWDETYCFQSLCQHCYVICSQL